MIEKIKSIQKKHTQVLRFVFSGGTSSLVNLVTLFVLTDFFHVWYLRSSFVAFFVSTTVNFVLQKYVTFNDFSGENFGRKIQLFFINGILDIGLNILGMYLLVDGLHVWYMLAQCIVIGTLAVKNYLVFKTYIFKK